MVRVQRSETVTNSLELLSQVSKANSYQSDLIKQSIVQEWLTETAEIMKDGSLRVLIVLSQQPSGTGSGIFLREVVDELQKLGHKPYLFAAHYRPLSGIDFPSLSDGQIYTMIFDNNENTDIAEISFAIPGMSLDMPYLHVTFRSLSEAMLNEYCDAWIAKLRTVVEKIRPHIIHVNHLWLLPGIARVAVPWIPIVATSHGTDYKLLVDAPKFASLVLPGVQHLDAVMPISSDTADASVTTFGVHSDKVHVIGNGYNEHLFRVLPQGGSDHVHWKFLAQFQDLPSWNKLVFYFGKFAEYKGVPYLIRAAKLYSEMSQDKVLTLIVGEGSKQARVNLEKLVEDLGLSKRVLLPGKVPYPEVCSLMNTADVFILPSIDEPFGLVLLEALACGLRSVAAERGGPSFFVPEDLREKALVTLIKPLKLLEPQRPDPRDEDRYTVDMATAILHHLSFERSEQERQQIAYAVRDQTWSAKVKEIVQVYTSAIQLRRQVVVRGS